MVEVRVFGGVDEIGGNKILVEDGDARIFLDFGMSFGKVGSFFADFMKPRTRAALPDLLALGALPALDGIYRQDCCRLDGVEPLIAEHGYEDLWCAPVESYDAYVERHGRPFVDAVVLTHAHLDHFGHFGYLDRRIPIYATPTTIAALRAVSKASRASGVESEAVEGKTAVPDEVKSGRFRGHTTIRTGEKWTRDLRPLTPYAKTRIPGTSMDVTAIPVDHSIPGAASILVETGGKKVYYSGDVRFHGTMMDVTKRLNETVQDLRPDLFLCEGTRVESELSDSEEDVRTWLADDFGRATGLCMVDFAWKDTTRYETLRAVAHQTGRTLVVSHRLAYVMRKLHEAEPARFEPIESDDLVRPYIRRMESMRYDPYDYNKQPLRVGYWDGTSSDMPEGDILTRVHWERGVRAPEIRRNPGRYILMLSQYEMQDLIDLQPPKGSTYVRAACEPFSDEMDLDLQRQANWLRHFGLPVQERDRGPIPVTLHASGHASGVDILALVDRVGAGVVVPIHTTHPDFFEKRRTDVLLPKLGDAIRV